MIKFYTPKEWHSLFDCPSLIIDNWGKIWAADQYYMVLSGEPCGRIDYQGGKIYGKDLGYGMLAEPIAYLETKNGVTRILDAKKGLSSAPILYIQDDKVYTPEQWTSLFDTPGGYIKKENPSDGTPSGKSSGTTASRKSSGGSARSGISLGGELGLLAGIALFLLIGNGVEAMFETPIWLALAGVLLATVLILRKVSGGPEIVRLKLSTLGNGMDPAKLSLCKVNAAICAGVMFFTFVLAAAMCMSATIGDPDSLFMRAAFSLKLILFALMAGMYWLEYLVFRNAMLLGRMRFWPIKAADAQQKNAVPEAFRAQPHDKAEPEAYEDMLHRKYTLPDDPEEPVPSVKPEGEPIGDAATEADLPQTKPGQNADNKKAAPVKVKVVAKKQPKK